MSLLERERTAADTIDVLDPATGERIGTIPAGSADAADAAVRAARAAQPAWARTAPGERAAILKAAARAARAAQPAWARTAPGERAAILKAAARRLHEHADELAELQTREGGKPLGDSRGGVDAGIGAIEQYAELGPLHRGAALQGQ